LGSYREACHDPFPRRNNLFRGKIVNLCGRLTQIPMTVNGTSTEEDFEIIKFFEDNAPFTMLIGKPWIDRDQARRKEEEEVLEQKKQELKDFMTKRIVHLIEEQKSRSQIFNTSNSDVEAKRTLEDPQKIELPIFDTEEVVSRNLRKKFQQCEVTKTT
jgi:predicted phage tail protein